jgi:DNA repair exonuclease SbcCD ATPase subunit
MTQKKKKSSAASHLIDSVMDDLQNVGEGSISINSNEPVDGLSDNSYDPIEHIDLQVSDPDKTMALASSSARSAKSSQRVANEVESEPEVKTSFGVARVATPRASASPSLGSLDQHLQQAENLSLAQTRILELEKQLDEVRAENDQLNSSLDVARSRLEEMTAKLSNFEKNRLESKEQAAIEQAILRENIQARDYQVDRLNQKVEELESRLQMDMKKVRVRERELENRLELSKAEKNALVRSKDETILDLKRKTEQLNSELSDSLSRSQDLIQKIESNQEQFSRTVRALRLALTNLEAHENTSSLSLSQLKKAD